MTNLTEITERVKELDAKRTQGEWRNGYNDGSGQDHVTAPSDSGSAVASTDPYGLFSFDFEITDQAKSNASFIAYAPTTAKALIEAHALLVECAGALVNSNVELKCALDRETSIIGKEMLELRVMSNNKTLARLEAAGIKEQPNEN